jgi:predicted RNA binding protein YcfA (HicA-like mRNA interferase family)
VPKPIYRELTTLLSEAGFVLHRQAKGSHEIWRRDSDSKQVTLARTIKSHVLANKILKDAGLPKHFS